MMVTRCKPLGNFWTEIHKLHDEMNRAIDQSDRGRRRPFAPAFPNLNAWDDGDNLQVEAELPGMELHDLEIYVAPGNRFTIKGERKAAPADNAKWQHRERGVGTFARTITLPVAVDADKVSATLTHGVLKVTLPKIPEVKPRRIPINVG